MKQLPAARRATGLVSPRAHSITYRICLPVMRGTGVWAARCSKPAATIILTNALGEGHGLVSGLRH